MPFDVAAHDGVLTLTLDTPRSPINVFNHATAHQLREILAAVTPATTRAVVFETAKPSSFINGVGLMLAQAAQSHADIARASAPPWEAYHAVRAAPVPTIAVVQGSCFGCGVEFALNCDYRIAADTCETQFYMTELNDYLFIPCFGGTWNLPAAVGLAASIDLLLWGERWSAATAGARGLVDAVVPPHRLADERRAFVQRVLAGAQPSRRRGAVRWSAEEDAVVERARRRIAALPPQYQPVYGDGLRLLVDGARQTRTYAEHREEELRCSAASAIAPIGKGAYAFFYLRQMAGERAAGRITAEPRPAALQLEVGDGEDARRFAADLRGRILADTPGAEARNGAVRLVAGRPAHATDVVVELALDASPAAATTLYAPTYRGGGRLVELATRAGSAGELPANDIARLARTLQRLGFEVARTNPRETFLSHRLLLAYLAPLTAFVARGGAVAVVNASLRAAGFVRRPHEVLTGLERTGLARALSAAIERPAAAALTALAEEDGIDTGADGTVEDALCVSLLAALLAIRARREVRDLSVADLIARELLDFPRHLCSLTTWLKRTRVARALERGAALRALVGAAVFDAAAAFAAGGRELYR